MNYPKETLDKYDRETREDYRKCAPEFTHKRDVILYLDATIERLGHVRDWLEKEGN